MHTHTIRPVYMTTATVDFKNQIVYLGAVFLSYTHDNNNDHDGDDCYNEYYSNHTHNNPPYLEGTHWNWRGRWRGSDCGVM